ncbi:hypothetical protein [Halobiforma nitratireducens]|uniref:Uncharacterized protein n=1 Tax=Halobiforma nitratireducens JCM 10879 TaxID=1227454 RepID=M0MRN9_9EURY|nr:hypothetical protein [Halobiforma nitratireducens]EMA47120.1 hypothetical protein C446_00355 [Halobiforma nitratireducens JCM 10879]
MERNPADHQTADHDRTPTTDLDSFQNELEHLRETTRSLTKRIDTLEAELEAKDNRIEKLEAERDEYRERTAELEDRVADLEADRARLESLAEAACNEASTNRDRLAELQARELEKGAHLRAEFVPDGRLERITTDDGAAYYRLSESADPLDGDDTTLAYGDLLPVQQLARMDEVGGRLPVGPSLEWSSVGTTGDRSRRDP